MQEETRQGYYKDQRAQWQKDRRRQADRRAVRSNSAQNDRRKHLRRKGEQEFLDREHREMVEEALEDFSAEQDGA